MKLVPYSKWMYGTKATVPLNAGLALLNLFLWLNTDNVPSFIVFVFISAATVYLYHLGTKNVEDEENPFLNPDGN